MIATLAPTTAVIRGSASAALLATENLSKVTEHGVRADELGGEWSHLTETIENDGFLNGFGCAGQGQEEFPQ